MSVSEIVGGHLPLHNKLVENSAALESRFKKALEDRTIFDLPFPCLIDTLDPIENLDSFFRMAMLLPKSDTKRVRAKVSLEIDRLREAQIHADPKLLAKDAKQQEYTDQVPRMSEAIWGVWDRNVIHANTNLKTIVNHFSNILEEPLLLSTPFIPYKDPNSIGESSELGLKDVWGAICIERMNKASIDVVQIIAHVMIGGVEAFSATMKFDEHKFHRFSIGATAILSPKTVFKLWRAATEKIMNDSSCVAFEIKASDLE